MGPSCPPWRGGGGGWAERGPRALWRMGTRGLPTAGPRTRPGVLGPGPGLILCSTSTWWPLQKLLPASKHSTITVSSFCCRAHVFSANYANQKASTSQVEERKGMKLWRGTQPREGLERITHYPLSPHSLYLLAGSKPPCRPTPEPQKCLWSLASMETTALGLVLPQPPLPTLHHPKSKPNKLWPDPETG